MRLGLADEVSVSVLPILIGSGISFFEKLDKDVPLHLAEAKAYRNGMVELRYEVKRPPRAVAEYRPPSSCGRLGDAPP
jgi:dihydrofolate reductase